MSLENEAPTFSHYVITAAPTTVAGYQCKTNSVVFSARKHASQVLTELTYRRDRHECHVSDSIYEKAPQTIEQVKPLIPSSCYVRPGYLVS